MSQVLPTGWNPKKEADKVLARLVNICESNVKGAHDSDFIIVDGHAYVVYMMNTVQPGEAPQWPFVSVAMAVVDLADMTVVQTIPVAASEQRFENVALSHGACFVPRILKLNGLALRCFFASEAPGQRQSQTWYRDFDLRTQSFVNSIHRAKLLVDGKLLDMQPQHVCAAASRCGFSGHEDQHGLYLIDSFKHFGGETYSVVNNFATGFNSLARLTGDMDTFEVQGFYLEPFAHKYTESAINRLPDGTWMAISRREDGDQDYGITTSLDGITWTPHEVRLPFKGCCNSKPTFDCFDGMYYVGWQDATTAEGVHRSVFNIEVSRDGRNWQRKYRFESASSFQYPVFRQDGDSIFLAVTQGRHSDCRKEWIGVAVLEKVGTE